ncbi:MAG: type II toxin-antitoxin system RelE/ParE family toxin [Pseudomonadota bacterium]
MIRSFEHKGLRRFWETGSTSEIQKSQAVRLRLILQRLNSAREIRDINFHDARLHPLKGDMKGLWSVTVSGNWRITFGFEDGDAYIVNYLDYH